LTVLPRWWHSVSRKRSINPFKHNNNIRTAPICATVLERIEIKTTKKISAYVLAMNCNHSLVNNKVLDNAANIVMRIGPNKGWKLEACAKLRYVLPNQICTINQAMDFSGQVVFPTGPESAGKTEMRMGHNAQIYNT
jgi:hypothetical protein